MTRMQSEKQQIRSELLKGIKRLRHLTGNPAEVVAIQKAVEELAL